MENAVVINEVSLPVREWSNQRVVTFADIDRVHDKPDGTAKRTFNKYKKYLTLNRHYYVVKPNDFQKYTKCTLGFKDSNIPNRGLTLITEAGYLMITKPISGDKAWEVQGKLVDSYFKLKEVSYSISEDLPLDLQSVNKTIQDLSNNFKIMCAQVNSMENAFDQQFEEFKNIMKQLGSLSLPIKKEKLLNIEEVAIADPIRDTIKPLAELYNDKSVGYNNTYRKVYAAMDVNWNYRKTRYKNGKGNKNNPSKFYLIESNEKLLSMFTDTVNKLIHEVSEDKQYDR